MIIENFITKTGISVFIPTYTLINNKKFKTSNSEHKESLW